MSRGLLTHHLHRQPLPRGPSRGQRRGRLSRHPPQARNRPAARGAMTTSATPAPPVQPDPPRRLNNVRDRRAVRFWRASGPRLQSQGSRWPQVSRPLCPRWPAVMIVGLRLRVSGSSGPRSRETGPGQYHLPLASHGPALAGATRPHRTLPPAGAPTGASLRAPASQPGRKIARYSRFVAANVFRGTVPAQARARVRTRVRIRCAGSRRLRRRPPTAAPGAGTCS